MKTNILRTLLLLMGLFFSVSLNAVEYNGIYYNINNDDMTASVSGYDHDLVDLVIADEIVYGNKVYKVTSIEALTVVWKHINGDAYTIDYHFGPFMTEKGFWHRKLNSLIIGKNITSIPDGTFRGCTGLSSITIGSSVEKIGSGAFWGCTGLTSVTIPNSVTSIGEGAFEDCIALTTIDIPNSVNSINDNVFSGCSSLNSLTIGSGVVSIGYKAFSNCTSLRSLVIPGNVASIKATSFLGCTGLESIKVEQTNNVFDSRENCNAIIESSTNTLLLGCMNSAIPSTVSRIGPNAFQDYVLHSFYITDNIKKIDDGNSAVKVIRLSDCFNNFSSYEVITIYDYSNLNSLFEVDGLVCVPVSPSDRTCAIIDNKNFKSTGCYDIGTVTYNGITFSVIKIGDYAFYKNNMRGVKLSFKGSIGSNAFGECDALETVEMNGITQIIAGHNGVDCGSFYGCDALVSVKVGDGITSIGGFADCKNLKQIELSNSVKEIKEYAFYGCSSLLSVKMGSGVSYVRHSAFSKCTSLKDIQLCNVQEIEGYAFTHCTALSNIVIPPSLKVIYAGAFNNCENLRNVIIESGSKLSFADKYSLGEWFDNCPLDSVYIGGNIGGAYNSPFSNKPIRVLLISGNANFGHKANMNGAFSYCKNLKTVMIEEGATEIGYRAFYGCSSLESVSIGSTVTSIGYEAFSGCANITKLICEAATPPSCSSKALTDINKWNCKLYVPANSITQYQAADQWKDFFFIDTIDHFLANVNSVQDQPVSILASNGLISVSNVEEGQRVAVYLVDGRQMALATAKNGTAQIVANVNRGNMIIVKIGSKVHKIMMQ